MAAERLTEAFLSCDFPGYMVLWPADKISQYDAEYQVAKYAPGFLSFGTNGGGELLAFDESGAVFCLPSIGLEPQYASPVADSWEQFESYIQEAT